MSALRVNARTPAPGLGRRIRGLGNDQISKPGKCLDFHSSWRNQPARTAGVGPPQPVAACRPPCPRRILCVHDHEVTRDDLRASVRTAAERAAEARRRADKLAVESWNSRLLGFKGPAQPSPTLGDALNAGYPHGPLPVVMAAGFATAKPAQ
jgi:hypothetical protein